MHEASIAASLLDIAIRECESKGFSVINGVKVQIGKASGVLPEALLFAFDALKTDTIASAASLLIEEIPVSGHCNICEADFTSSENYVLCCPDCAGVSFFLKSGREMDITEIEVF